MKNLIRRSAIFAFTLALFLPTAATASAQISYDPSEGGWVDVQNNLVWGLDYAYFTTTAPNGSTGFGTPVEVDWATAQSMAANYPALLDQYAWYGAATVAAYWESRGLDWRQPTAREVTAACKAGFLQKLYWYPSIPRWTSNFASKRGVFVGAYVIYLDNGSVELNIANPGFPIFVRPYR
jgi:hypothetical protein